MIKKMKWQIKKKVNKSKILKHNCLQSKFFVFFHNIVVGVGVADVDFGLLLSFKVSIFLESTKKFLKQKHNNNNREVTRETKSRMVWPNICVNIFIKSHAYNFFKLIIKICCFFTYVRNKTI